MSSLFPTKKKSIICYSAPVKFLGFKPVTFALNILGSSERK